MIERTPLVGVTCFLITELFLLPLQQESSVTISVEEPININIGIDATICESNAAIGYRFDDATSSSINVNYAWTALGGDGSFDDDTNLNATYFPGANDISNGSVVLELTATSTTGICTDPETDTATLNITPSATVSAGANAITLCENESHQVSTASAQFYDPTSISWSSSGTTREVVC